MISISKKQARQFLLLKQGLLGGNKYSGIAGVLEYIRSVNCIQFDPVDICGRNVDILLLSRITNYSKDMLEELIYFDRKLVDYFDKNLSIFPTEDLPALYNLRVAGGYADAYDKRGGDAVKQIEPIIREHIREKGYVSAAEIDIDETIEWHWGIMTSLQRAALESMYFRGELIIHHKTGTNKSYAFTKDHIPAEILNSKLPYQTAEERIAWFIKRRIGSVGFLHNTSSDAWLGTSLKARERNMAFTSLLENKEISEVSVEGLNLPIYIRTEDMFLLEEVLKEKEYETRTELLAPLDNMLWDRKLIHALFDFYYRWEIYTPKEKRVYGAYVLPILSNEQLIGRVETIRNSKEKTLQVKNIWYEEGVKITKELNRSMEECFMKLAVLNGCEKFEYLS